MHVTFSLLAMVLQKLFSSLLLSDCQLFYIFLEEVNVDKYYATHKYRACGSDRKTSGNANHRIVIRVLVSGIQVDLNCNPEVLQGSFHGNEN